MFHKNKYQTGSLMLGDERHFHDREMQNTRVRPMVAFNWPDSAKNSPVPMIDDAADNYFRHGNRCNSHVRQAFLRSYQFTAKEDFKQKLKRSVKEISEVAMAAVVEIRQEISSKFTEFKVFRFRFTESPLALARHFLKWHVKGCRGPC